MNMKKLSLVLIATVLISVLSGCAGLLLLASSFVAIGNLVGQIENLGLFDRDTSKYSLYLDGYDTGIHPNPSGTLNLTGLPVGPHVLSLVYDTKRVGFHTNVSVVENQQLSLGSITLAQGSIISGKVQRVAGVPLAGVRVAAILGGGALLAQGQSPVQLPTGSGNTVIMGFTDANGNFSLGPAAPGQWLVTSAAANSYADAAIVSVATGTDAGNISLMLTANPSASVGTVSGTVTREGAGALADAFVGANYQTAFTPPIPDARATAIQSQVGLTLMPQPWFQWKSLATTTSAAGAYTLQSASGAQSINAFKFGHRAKATDVTLGDGESVAADFALPGL
jgi:hypothetical protein